MAEISAETTVSFDEMLDALVHVQRRKLFVSLLDHNPQDDSPAVVVDPETDPDSIELLIEMRHVHLPKLADKGLIEWNRRDHEVVKGPNFDEIRPLLELLDDHQDELPDDWL